MQQSVAVYQGVGWSTTPLATLVYAYDTASRVAAETDKEGTASFTYDNANELTGVTGSRSESYGFDANGNRNTTGYSTGTENEMTASPGVTYSYDNAGNLTSQTNTSTHVTTSYSYDYRNRLTSASTGGTAMATFTYNALNQRIGVKDGGTQTWTVFDGTSPFAHPYADFNGSGSLLTRYLFGPGVVNGAIMPVILARTSSGGTTAWYLTDKLGSVRDIVDASGNSLDHVVYDSFGNIVSETNAGNGDRFKFAMMQSDTTIGQNYDNARWYGSVPGRFVNHDPLDFVAGDTNLYRYVGNSPVALVDPTGLDWLDLLSNFGAGWGDTLTFGGTALVRNMVGYGEGVDPNSGAYMVGIGVGLVHSTLLGSSIRTVANPGLVRGMSRMNIAMPRGVEWVERSHWIPRPMLPPSLQWARWNLKLLWGSDHALVDAFRYQFLPAWWKMRNPMLSPLARIIIRMPYWIQGSLAGAAYGLTSAALQAMARNMLAPTLARGSAPNANGAIGPPI
jgi:RHS repeat-associated protein